MVKFFDFRETDIDLRTMLFFVLFQEFRKTMEGLRSEDHVDVGEHGERCCRLPGWRHSRPQQS